MKKQMRKVSPMLVALVLVIGASSLFVGCNQPNNGGNSDNQSNKNNGSTNSNNNNSSNQMEYSMFKNVEFSNIDKFKRSVFVSGNVKKDNGTNLDLSFTAVFNENFTSLTIENFYKRSSGMSWTKLWDDYDFTYNFSSNNGIVRIKMNRLFVETEVFLDEAIDQLTKY